MSAPDGDDLDLNFAKEIGKDSEEPAFKFESVSEKMMVNQRRRLSCFTEIAVEDCHSPQSIRTITSETDSNSNKSYSDEEQEKHHDIEAILDDSF